MTRLLFTTVLLAFNLTVCLGQISVYHSREDNVIGWSVGSSNTDGVRDSKAYQHCKERGGKFPILLASYNGYGCYAIMAAYDDKGVKQYGFCSNYKTVEDAITCTKNGLAHTLHGNVKSYEVVTSGCVEAPPPPPKKVPIWSDWTSGGCQYLEYRTKVIEGYDWNYQVHIYIQVRSKFKIPVTYVFELADENGKVHFGNQRRNNPGETIEFVHKMSGNIIKKLRIMDLRNGETDKPMNCDEDDGGKARKQAADAAKFNSLQEAIREYNKLLPQVPDGHTKITTERITQDVLSKDGYSTDYKLNVVNDAIDRLRAYISQSGGKAAVNESLAELTEKETSLVNEIKSMDPNAQVSVLEVPAWQNGDFMVARKKENIARMEKMLGDLNAKAGAEKERKDREKTAFNGLMQKGNDAMNSKDYARAIGSYQAAMNGTSDPDDKALATARYNMAVEAKKTADRQVRVEEFKKNKKEENALYGTAATATAGAMVFLKDQYSSRPFAAKFLLGLGYEHSPILSNGNGQSYIEERNLLTLHTGFSLGVLNNRAVSFYLKPQLNVGMSVLMPGTTGGYVSYGGAGILQLAVKKHSKFNVFAEGGWFRHSGTFKYDADAANNTATDDVREGNMTFSKLHYGGGFMLRWINSAAGKETYIRPGVYFEKPSFLSPGVKPVLSMNLQVYIYSAILLDVSYTHNTYIAGELHHPATLERKNVNAYGVKLIRQGRLY